MPPPFSPLDFGPGVVISWHDAKDGSTLFLDDAGTLPAGDGAAVRRVSDKSGNGSHALQPTAANRMTRNASLGELIADGGDRYNAFSFAGGPRAQPMGCAFVARVTNNNGAIFDFSAPRWLGSRGATGTAVLMHAAVSLSAAVSDMAVRAAHYFEYNGANSKIFRNGTQVGSAGNAGTNSATGFGLGGVSAGFMIGGFGELLVFSRLLTAPEQAQLQAYFASKWGL